MYKTVTTIPEWFSLIPKGGALSSADVSVLFGFKNKTQAASSAYQGWFPQPDIVLSRRGKGTKAYWKKSTVVKEIKRRGAL